MNSTQRGRKAGRNEFYDRYHAGTAYKPCTSMYTMLEMAVRLEKKYHKKTTLQDLDIEVDVLRNLLRLAKDPNLYPNQKPCLNFHTWEVWMRKVDEIGRMIGGYSEWVNSRERQK